MYSTRFNKLTSLVIASLFTLATASPASTNVRSFSAVGDVAAVQSSLATGDTRLYGQTSTGEIIQTCVSNAFNVGTDNCGTITIAPASEVLSGTPIAAVNLPDQNTYGSVHVYFVSPDHVLSEYIYTPGIGFQGGATCPACITHQGFQVVEGSQAFYAMGSDTTSRELRVGFVSQGAPGTITEAVYDGTRWQTAGLPN